MYSSFLNAKGGQYKHVKSSGYGRNGTYNPTREGSSNFGDKDSESDRSAIGLTSPEMSQSKFNFYHERTTPVENPTEVYPNPIP